MEPYANLDRDGNQRWYQTVWDRHECPDGRLVDIELVSAAPADPPANGRGQAAWVASGPVEYRVRPSGQGADAWRPLVFTKHGQPFGQMAAAAAYGD
jgi:hypothetical protein